MLFLLTSWVYYCYLYVDKFTLSQSIDVPTSLELNLATLVYSVYSNGGIIFAYLIIYLKLNTVYYGMIQDGDQSDHESQTMRGNLKSLMILFISICQIYVFRITRDFMILLQFYDQLYILRPLFHVCKILMILGICISVYQRLRLSSQYIDYYANNVILET